MFNSLYSAMKKHSIDNIDAAYYINDRISSIFPLFSDAAMKYVLDQKESLIAQIWVSFDDKRIYAYKGQKPLILSIIVCYNPMTRQRTACMILDNPPNVVSELIAVLEEGASAMTPSRMFVQVDYAENCLKFDAFLSWQGITRLFAETAIMIENCRRQYHNMYIRNVRKCHLN